MVRDAGFDVGMRVVRKADQCEAEIVRMLAEIVELKKEDGTLWQASAQAFVSGQWKRQPPKKDEVKISWTDVGDSLDFQAAVLRSRVLLALQEQHASCKDSKKVEIFIRPVRDVQAQGPHAVGKLRLPCTTTKVEIKPASHPPPANAICIGAARDFQEETLVYLMPAVTLPKEGEACTSPVWMMKTTCDKDEGNMEILPKQLHKQKIRSPVQAPYVSNFRKLAAGESLILYRPGAVKPEPLVEELREVKKPRLT
jgi:hypothetical protein